MVSALYPGQAENGPRHSQSECANKEEGTEASLIQLRGDEGGRWLEGMAGGFNTLATKSGATLSRKLEELQFPHLQV